MTTIISAVSLCLRETAERQRERDREREEIEMPSFFPAIFSFYENHLIELKNLRRLLLLPV